MGSEQRMSSANTAKIGTFGDVWRLGLGLGPLPGASRLAEDHNVLNRMLALWDVEFQDAFIARAIDTALEQLTAYVRAKSTRKAGWGGGGPGEVITRDQE